MLGLYYNAVLMCVITTAMCSPTPQNVFENRPFQNQQKRAIDFFSNRLVRNPKVRRNYLDCFLDHGPCSPEAKNIKRMVPDAIQNECEHCTELQKKIIEKMMCFLNNEQPEILKQVAAKFDPNGEYMKQYINKIENDQFLNPQIQQSPKNQIQPQQPQEQDKNQQQLYQNEHHDQNQPHLSQNQLNQDQNTNYHQNHQLPQQNQPTPHQQQQQPPQNQPHSHHHQQQQPQNSHQQQLQQQLQQHLQQQPQQNQQQTHSHHHHPQQPQQNEQQLQQHKRNIY